jgi:hypothetical protein
MLSGVEAQGEGCSVLFYSFYLHSVWASTTLSLTRSSNYTQPDTVMPNEPCHPERSRRVQCEGERYNAKEKGTMLSLVMLSGVEAQGEECSVLFYSFYLHSCVGFDSAQPDTI